MTPVDPSSSRGALRQRLLTFGVTFAATPASLEQLVKGGPPPVRRTSER